MPNLRSFEDGFAITPSDTVNFTKPCWGIYVGVTGDVVVVLASAAVLTFKAVPAGTVLQVMAKRVNSTSTTATNLLGLGPF